MLPVEIWGTVAEWVSGVGTVAAVFTALFVYTRQQRDAAVLLSNGLEQLKLSQQSFERQLAESESRHASEVAAWLENVEVGVEGSEHWLRSDAERLEMKRAQFENLRQRFTSASAPSELPPASVGEDNGSGDRCWLIIVWQNLSHQPVFDVEVRFAKGPSESERLDELQWSVWPPSDSSGRARVTADGSGVDLPRNQAAQLVREVGMELRFTDAMGRRWVRNRDGGLTRS